MHNNYKTNNNFKIKDWIIFKYSHFMVQLDNFINNNVKQINKFMMLLRMIHK